MPKVVQYSKGSIIFFIDDKDSRIFILQSGGVVLSSQDIETGANVVETVRTGEIFGVKSALSCKPRMETATAATDTQVVQLTVSEFEKLFSTNQKLILKMMRVYSGQLRAIHKKTESILHDDLIKFPPELGMLIVAKAFFENEEYSICVNVCKKIIETYPDADNIQAVQSLLNDAQSKSAEENTSSSDNGLYAVNPVSGDWNILKQFYQPVFDRFLKHYKKNDIILTEFEAGESFFLIKSGDVQLVKCIRGTHKNLDILHPGEIFGEMAILDNSPRSATAIARTDVDCLEFNKENFQAIITGNPQLSMFLLKLFCKRIFDQRRRFKILVIKDIPTRICDVFLLYDELTPVNPALDETDLKRKFYLSVTDVAQWAVISIDTAQDELNKMVSKGKIEIFEDYMIVRNIADMKRSVNTYFSTNMKKD